VQKVAYLRSQGGKLDCYLQAKFQLWVYMATIMNITAPSYREFYEKFNVYRCRAQRQKCVDLYLHSPIRLHCLMLYKNRYIFTTAVIAQSGYGLDDRDSNVRFPVGAGNFSFYHRVHNGSGAHPASSTMDTGGSFPGD
jgi:hypothetical protein